jgi:hypothetical protein
MLGIRTAAVALSTAAFLSGSAWAASAVEFSLNASDDRPGSSHTINASLSVDSAGVSRGMLVYIAKDGVSGVMTAHVSGADPTTTFAYLLVLPAMTQNQARASAPGLGISFDQLVYPVSTQSSSDGGGFPLADGGSHVRWLLGNLDNSDASQHLVAAAVINLANVLGLPATPACCYTVTACTQGAALEGWTLIWVTFTVTDACGNPVVGARVEQVESNGFVLFGEDTDLSGNAMVELTNDPLTKLTVVQPLTGCQHDLGEPRSFVAGLGLCGAPIK